MIVKNNEVQKARRSLIQQTFDKVCNVPSYSDFRSNTFCVIAHLGLQLIAKKEGLLDGEDWYKFKNKILDFGLPNQEKVGTKVLHLIV